MTRSEVKSFFGSADGDRASQFPDFKYMFATEAPIIRICERVDFVVEIKEESAWKAVFEVFLLPNKYTAATERKRIFKFQADTWQMHELSQLVNWAADQAFRSHDPR